MAVGAVVAIVASVAIALVATTAESAHNGNHFSVIARGAEGTITPANFGANPKQGDTAAADDPVYRKGKRVGQAETLLTITRVTDEDVTVIIECSVELPRGNVFFNGSFNFGDLAGGALVPVVGGTGIYRGARGTVKLKAGENGDTKLTFRLIR